MIFLVLVLVLKVVVTVLKTRKISFRLHLKKILIMAAVVGIVVFSTYKVIDKYSFSMERSLQRLTLLLDIGSDASVSTRLSYIDFSIDKIFENAGNFLFGSGIGSFGILYSGVDRREYPHNIFLEIQFELGLVGIAAIILFLIFYLKKIRFRGPLIYPFLYIFLNSLKSGSFTDLRIMFGFFSIFLLYDAFIKRKKFLNEEK
jgi:O-antigen ligase